MNEELELLYVFDAFLWTTLEGFGCEIGENLKDIYEMLLQGIITFTMCILKFRTHNQGLLVNHLHEPLRNIFIPSPQQLFSTAIVDLKLN